MRSCSGCGRSSPRRKEETNDFREWSDEVATASGTDDRRRDPGARRQRGGEADVGGDSGSSGRDANADAGSPSVERVVAAVLPVGSGRTAGVVVGVRAEAARASGQSSGGSRGVAAG